MDNRIQDFTSALERDKAPVYYLGVICVSIGLQIHAFTMASAGMEVPSLPEQDNIVKGFYITGFTFSLFSFLLVVTSLFKDTVHPRSALVICVITTLIGVLCTGTAISVFAKHTIDLKYRPGEFAFPYPYSAFVAATAVSLVGALSLLINVCTE